LAKRKTYRHTSKHERDQMKNYEYRSRSYSSGNKPSNMTVLPRKNEHPERVIKRFIKKCKKEGVLDKFREKMYFEKNSVKRRKKKIRRERAIEKHNASQKTNNG